MTSRERLEVLRACEFPGASAECPLCEGSGYGPNHGKHSPDCKFAELIAETEAAVIAEEKQAGGYIRVNLALVDNATESLGAVARRVEELERKEEYRRQRDVERADRNEQ